MTFTKVLNLHEEPLALSVRVMRLHTLQMTQMGLQLSTFIAGLLLALWQWRRPRRNSFILTLALALVLVRLATSSWTGVSCMPPGSCWRRPWRSPSSPG